jgi:MerR family transcriptional regulator, redox-sensitive transcriptional activator SoxR
MSRDFSVGELAERCGVAVSTLHFYETKKLIRSARSRGNQRRYEKDVIRRVSVIKFAQELGIPLSEIGQALSALPDSRTPTRNDWKIIAAKWSKALDKRIVRLQRLRANLDDCIGCGCLSLRRCRIRNPDDRLAAEGSGPQHLLDERLGEE